MKQRHDNERDHRINKQWLPTTKRKSTIWVGTTLM